MHVGAEHRLVVRALRAVPGAVAPAELDRGEGAGRGAEPGDALVVLETRQLGQAQARVDVPEDVADAPLALAAYRRHVEQAEAGLALTEVVDELVAEDLIARAHGEHDRAVLHRPVQMPVTAQPLRREPLRPVLAAADQIDVAGCGDGLVAAYIEPRHIQTALPRTALHDEGVALIAVGAEQIRVDPHQPQLIVAHQVIALRGQLPTRRRRSWNAV